MSDQTAADLARRWAADPRWAGVERSYSAQDVVRLAGTVVDPAGETTSLRGSTESEQFA